MAAVRSLSAVGQLLDVDDLDTLPQPHRRRPSRRAVVAGGAAVTVLAAAATLAWPSGGTRPTPAVSPPAVAAPPRVVDPARSGPLDTAIPTAGPAVTWQSFQGVVLPYSATAGPSMVRGPVFAGYAHTPTGALLAASQIWWRFAATPHGGWRTVAAEQVMPGPGRDMVVALRASVDDPGPGDSLTQTVGFRFDAYSPALAVIDVATRDTSGTLQSATRSVAWSHGDWRLALPPDGAAHSEVIPSLAGYVPWSGVS